MAARSIKFRAWDTLKKVMIAEGFHVIGEVTMFNAIDEYVIMNLEGKSSLDRYGDIEIMQFTGLQDIKGKDIYEGDLIRFAEKYLYVVRFEDAKFVGYHANNDWGKWGDLYRLTEFEFYKHGYFVVGNIFKNPELIPQTT